MSVVASYMTMCVVMPACSYDEFLAEWEASKVGYEGPDPRDIAELGRAEVMSQQPVEVSMYGCEGLLSL